MNWEKRIRFEIHCWRQHHTSQHHTCNNNYYYYTVTITKDGFRFQRREERVIPSASLSTSLLIIQAHGATEIRIQHGKRHGVIIIIFVRKGKGINPSLSLGNHYHYRGYQREGYQKGVDTKWKRKWKWSGNGIMDMEQ